MCFHRDCIVYFVDGFMQGVVYVNINIFYYTLPINTVPRLN